MKSLKSKIAAFAIIASSGATAIAMLPGSAPVVLGPTIPVANGATTVAFSPAANPAFKVAGFTTCASGRTGHLWQATTITATSVKDSQTTEVQVKLGQGSTAPTVHLPAPGFSATVPTSQSFDCAALNGSALPYVATSYKGTNAQNSSSAGNYSITKVD